MVPDSDSAFHLDYYLQSKGHIFLLLSFSFSISSFASIQGRSEGTVSISWNRLKTITGNLRYQMTSWTKARLEVLNNSLI